MWRGRTKQFVWGKWIYSASADFSPVGGVWGEGGRVSDWGFSEIRRLRFKLNLRFFFDNDLSLFIQQPTPLYNCKTFSFRSNYAWFCKSDL